MKTTHDHLTTACAALLAAVNAAKGTPVEVAIRTALLPVYAIKRELDK